MNFPSDPEIDQYGSWGLYLLVRFEHALDAANKADGSWGLYLLVRFEHFFH